MKVSIAVNGGKITLNHRQMEDVLKGMAYALEGNQQEKNFGEVTVSTEKVQGKHQGFTATDKDRNFTDC